MSNDAFNSPSTASLADAVRRDDAAEVRRQLQQVPADTPGSQGETLLMEAIRQRRAASVEALLEGGADPDRVDARGETPVHAAAFSGNPAILRSVLAHGGDKDARNPHTGATPLVQALLSPEAGQAEVLLEAGADPDIADRNGDMPLHVAARTNGGAAILALLRSGADPEARNSRGDSFQVEYFSFPANLLSARARDERREIVAWLKAHGVPLEKNVTDAD
ncbi:ankyrin repeat domain-containing protein [Luteimonas sp. TWI1416]|uniref:ankyrin repeat domain-containing protein n=1 Tax=unclassified Luteimonas TaxID=2629088 RepID=UPI0032090586